MIINAILLLFLGCLMVAMLIGGVVFWCAVVVAIWRGAKELRK